MYQRAEICLPRKKKVREAFRSNTFRIFDEKAPERLNPDEVIKDHKYASRDPEVTETLKTHNVPQPYNVKFIRTNVRFLNEPLVHMETENTKDEQSKWWLNTPEKNDPRETAYSMESTQRRDYQLPTHIPVTRVREERNKLSATGIIPTLSPLGQPKELVEHMSFIHQYDSRRIHNQPYQGKRHGAFVWSERGAMGPSAFQSSEGLRSDSEGKTYNMNSSQHALQSSPQMFVSTGTFFPQSSPDNGNSYNRNGKRAGIPT
ncbi:uncharacterized protein C2orf73 homolog [Tachysurus vachellii]|uniref:uncharacterized protein C2orf73 homolog n=1 Tax=Tachysurus vachellii TaxID=175792 RepID=UPI00296AB7F6|nr:uncharacterized protein C2orf73 homolog [Tachysurus vachellii]